MMTYEQYLLNCLMEECLELAHISSKALRFGTNDTEPDEEITNVERMDNEFNDILGVALCLREIGIPLDSNFIKIKAKMDKVKEMFEYSKRMGRAK